MTRIRFENLPSTNTPINAENLNKLNNVIVSSEEPTTGEEVWIQASGNLFDKNNYNLWNGWINESNNTFTENSKGYLVYIPCSPNTTYIVSREVLETNFKVGVADKIPINQGTLTNVINNPYGNSITITSGANDSYLHIYVHYESDTNYTLEQILDSLRVEISKKIHTKTDNGYEEFYSEKPEVKKGRLNITVMPTSEISSSYQNQVTIIEGNITTTGGDLLIMLSVGKFKTSSGNSYITAFVNENNVGRIIGSSKGEYSSESGTDIVTNISAGTHKISMKLAPNTGYTAYVGSFNQITLTVIEL